MEQEQKLKFNVGDGVHWNVGSDTYPGTIRKISPSRHKIWVSSDSVSFKDAEPTFTPQDLPEKSWQLFTRRGDGSYKESGSEYTQLYPVRHYYWDPSF